MLISWLLAAAAAALERDPEPRRRLLRLLDRVSALPPAVAGGQAVSETVVRKGDLAAERARLEAAAALDRDPDLRRRLLRPLEYHRFHRRWRQVAN